MQMNFGASREPGDPAATTNHIESAFAIAVPPFRLQCVQIYSEQMKNDMADLSYFMSHIDNGDAIRLQHRR